MKKVHDSETPVHGQQVISACAFIHDAFDDVRKVFLPRRADTKKFLPGIYELPGGHIDFGEDIVAGLKREIMEEFGMTIKVGEPFAAFTYINEVKGSHTIEVVYFAQFVEPHKQIQLHPEDHSTFDWFSQKDVFAKREFLIPQGQVVHEHTDDPEYLAILQGFRLLEAPSP